MSVVEFSVSTTGTTKIDVPQRRPIFVVLVGTTPTMVFRDSGGNRSTRCFEVVVASGVTSNHKVLGCYADAGVIKYVVELREWSE